MNCEGTIIRIFFPKDTYFSTVIHDLQFVESWNAELQIWRANYKVIQGYLIAQGASVPTEVLPAAPTQLQPPSGGLALPLLWAQPSLILTPGDPGTAPAPPLTPALIFSTCKLPHFPGEWMGARTWLGNCHTPPCSLLDRTLLQDRDKHVRVPAEARGLAWSRAVGTCA